MACLSQFWDWLENRKSEGDEISREVWKVVKAKAEKTGVAKTKERKEKRRRKKEKRREETEKEERKEKEEKTEKRENNRSKEGSREVRDLK